ncbi:thioredoxin [Umboniibacter marinipuniceus]|uniref:Thioredoxin n=2 Tax=Umboniibacter marinipuniceus TaxID=569599 RepID=A0A3L9ZZ62_9GAMM|nr:thioredoxin [Umboniibacter marinipuniceus]
MIIMCPHCSGLNRVPENKMGAEPHCGMCRQLVFTGGPVSFNRAQFIRARDKSDQLLVVDFWADWCGPCRSFAPTFKRAAEVLDQQARFVKVDTQAEETLARELNIRSLPTIAVYRHGKELNRLAGALDLAQFTKWLAPYL